MNEEKIDLILRGINLLVVHNKEIDQEIRDDFNKSFFDIFNPKKEKSIAEETSDALVEDNGGKEK